MAMQPVEPPGIHHLKKDQTIHQSAAANHRSIVQSHYNLFWNVPSIFDRGVSLTIQINNFSWFCLCGPTGVKLLGALAELNFKRIKRQAILVKGCNNVQILVQQTGKYFQMFKRPWFIQNFCQIKGFISSFLRASAH